MNTPVSPSSLASIKLNLPGNRGAYYGGKWHEPKSGRTVDQVNPGTGESLGSAADCGAQDIDAAVKAAKAAFKEWRRIPPLERAKMLKEIARVLRENAGELAMIDAADCGNPLTEMMGDANVAAAQMEFFAGLVTEMKGASIPMGPDRLNFSVREPLRVVGRIVPFNHPFMFIAGKSAAPLAAGNTIVMKPPEQAPLSSLRLAELIDGLLPPGVFNLVPGGKEAGAALASHPEVAKIALIGSVPTGRAVMQAASGTLKKVLLELGGKNALIAYADKMQMAGTSPAITAAAKAWTGSHRGGDPLLQLLLRRGADLPGGELAVLEQHQGRDRHDAELRRGAGILVDVELDDLDLAIERFGNLFQRRRDHPARAAPFRPKIDHHGLTGLEHVLIEGRVGCFVDH
jgi:betaine-aldehyde dehydrogenase